MATESQSFGGVAQSGSDTILEIRNANVTFEHGRGQARVLDDVNLDVYRGEVLGIVGESGSGKSMFMSTILDAVEDPGLASGEVNYFPSEGEPVNILDLSPKNRKRVRWEEIALVSQHAQNAFNPVKPIGAHFKDTLEAHNADEEEGMERARGIMEDLNLDPETILESYQHELSGGQRQRSLVALGVLLDPEVLILDEPTAALDLLTQRKILRLLRQIKDEYDLTLIVVSHDLPIVSGFADRIGVMYSFDLVELGETEDVLRNAAHPYTRALLNATPDLKSSIGEITTIEGSTPDPVNIPRGCSYHPRCPISQDRCEVEEPELLELEDEQSVACFFPDQARLEIHNSLSEDTS